MQLDVDVPMKKVRGRQSYPRIGGLCRLGALEMNATLKLLLFLENEGFLMGQFRLEKRFDTLGSIQANTGLSLKGFRRFVGFPSRKNGFFQHYETNKA
jgi:hypothetical protein